MFIIDTIFSKTCSVRPHDKQNEQYFMHIGEVATDKILIFLEYLQHAPLVYFYDGTRLVHYLFIFYILFISSLRLRQRELEFRVSY